MDNVFATERASLVKDIAFIDGITRSGKFLLAKIVSGLKDVEYFQYIHIVEQIPYIFRLGGITENAAIALLKSTIDRHAYDMSMGRSINLYCEDRSSIFNAPNFYDYLSRMFRKHERKDIIEFLKNKERMFLYLTHNTLPNINLLFQAYPNLKVIYLVRHPIDLTYSWFLKGYGDFGNPDLLKLSPDIKGVSYPVPWYAFNWRDEYDSINDAERIIKSISVLTEMSKKAYKALSKEQKQRIMFVRYEDLIEDTRKVIRGICGFLNKNESDGMAQILARERCPNSLSNDLRKKKNDELLKEVSGDYKSSLLILSDEYEDKVRGFVE
tara:strand:+ start:76 stop:1050 length:975 start_codon:yes stop_codon:yes gene_type:complete